MREDGEVSVVVGGRLYRGRYETDESENVRVRCGDQHSTWTHYDGRRPASIARQLLRELVQAGRAGEGVRPGQG